MRPQPRPINFRQLIQLAPRDWARLALVTMVETSTWEGALGWLAELADAHQVDTLADLVATVGRDPELFGYKEAQPPNVTDELGEHGQAHRRRNLLAALCSTQALREGRTGGGLLAQVPTLPVRTPLLRGRPLFDDERLLMRLVVIGLLREGQKRYIAAAKYVLAEVGATPGEVTNVYLDQLNDPRHPTKVKLPGNAVRARRPGNLDRWQSEVLGVIATTQAAEGNIEEPLAYHGHSKPGSSRANMACHRSLVPLLERAGIKNQDVTASSISSPRRTVSNGKRGLSGSARPRPHEVTKGAAGSSCSPRPQTARDTTDIALRTGGSQLPGRAVRAVPVTRMTMLRPESPLRQIVASASGASLCPHGVEFDVRWPA